MTSDGSAVPFNFIFKRVVQVTSKSHSFLLAVHKRWVMGFKASLPREVAGSCFWAMVEPVWAVPVAVLLSGERPCTSQGSLAGPAPQHRWFSCHSLPLSRIILTSHPDLGSSVRCLSAVEELQLCESNSDLQRNIAPDLIRASKLPWAQLVFSYRRSKRSRVEQEEKIQLVSVGAESGPSWGKGISGNSLQRDVCTGKQSCFTGNLTHALEPVRSERPNKTRTCWFLVFLFGCWVVLLSPYSHPPPRKNRRKKEKKRKTSSF